MLGTQSFSPVSTGFSTDSRAMVPVSIQGMAGKLQKISTFDSMQEIFLEIRDGISNLTESIKNQTGLLHSTLLGVIHTLTNIGSIVAKDLDLEETQTNIDIENERDEDKDESLKDDEKDGKSIIPPALKKGFNSVVEYVKNLSFIESLIALGAGLFLLMFNFEKIGNMIGFLVKKTDEEVIPRVKAFGSTIFELGENLIDGLFGKNGVFPVILGGLGGIIDDIKKGEGKAAILGVGKTLINGTSSVISLIGTTILGAIKVVAKTVDPDADLSALDELIEYFNDIPEKVEKKLDADAKEYKKVLDEKGFFPAQGIALRQTYDNLIGNSLNTISDIFGIALKPVNEDLGNYLMDADYTAKGISSAFQVSMKNLGLAMEKSRNGISKVINDILDDMNKYLPDFMKIDSRMIITKDGKDVSTYVNDEGMTVPMYRDAEIGKDINVLGKKDDKPIDEVMREQILGPGFTTLPNGEKFYFEKQPATNEELSEMMDNKDSNMTLKTKELKAAASVSQSESTSIVAPNFITDNKKIDNSNNSSQAVTVTDQRVDSMEGSSNAVLNYYSNIK